MHNFLNTTLKTCLLILMILFGMCQLATAQIATEWIGGDGLWSDQAMWTLGAPDDSEEHEVTVDISPQDSIVYGAFGAIISLDISAGDEVRIGFDTAFPGSLRVVDYIANYGTVEIEEAISGFNQIVSGGAFVLGGDGPVIMNRNTQIIFNQFDERTLENITTIEGTGEIRGREYMEDSNVDFFNGGVVNANNVGEGISIFARINNTGGTLAATNGGHILLEDESRVLNGIFFTATGGTIRTQDTILVEGTMIDADVEVLDATSGINSTLILTGPVANSGDIKLDTINTPSLTGKRILMRDSITLTGGGSVTLLSDSTGLQATIGSERFPPTNLLLDNVDNTIQGSGTIGDVVEPYFGDIDVTNSGNIIANVDQQELLITSVNRTSVLTNTGTMLATLGGQLGIREIDVDNAAGTIIAENNSTVSIGDRFDPDVDSYGLNGGTMLSTGTGKFFLGSIIENVAMDIDGEFRALTLKGDINNARLLAGVSIDGFDSNLSLDGMVVLSGGGTICLADVINANETIANTFTNQDNTLMGSGDLHSLTFELDSESSVDPGTDDNRLGSLVFGGDGAFDALTKIDAIQPGTDPTVINQDPASIDVVRVEGEASVGAVFELNFLEQLVPEVGDFFDVFSADNISTSNFSIVAPTGYSVQAIVVNLPEGGGNRDAIRVTITDVPGPISISPTSFLVTRGTYVSGTAADLADSDNVDVSARRSSIGLQGIVEIEFETTTSTGTQSRIDVTLESSVFARSQVNLAVSAFNYTTGQFDIVGSGEASRFIDSTVTYPITGNAADYVNNGNLKVRATYMTVIPRQQYSVNVDQVQWTIIE